MPLLMVAAPSGFEQMAVKGTPIRSVMCLFFGRIFIPSRRFYCSLTSNTARFVPAQSTLTRGTILRYHWLPHSVFYCTGFSHAFGPWDR